MKHKKKKEEEKEGDGVEEEENVEDLVVNSVCAEEEEEEQEEQEVIEETDELEFELLLKWQIESDCFAQLVANPVAILNKLPGALFLLGGDHYWHFYRDFYRWAALESEDATVRYAGKLSVITSTLFPSILIIFFLSQQFRHSTTSHWCSLRNSSSPTCATSSCRCVSTASTHCPTS